MVEDMPEPETGIRNARMRIQIKKNILIEILIIE